MNLSQIAAIPEVDSVVLGDLSGVYIDSVNHPDGEAIAAVMGFAASQLRAAGQTLGLGALHRVSLTGGTAACLVALDSGSVFAAYFDPRKSSAVVEKKIRDLSRG
jgi:predicted regulator of Ras-like GTPase activity (Roadblock/LC7/MglB family)